MMLEEVRAAELAAERRTDADLTALDAALAARDDAFAGPAIEAFIDADIALHAAVVAAAHNPVLAGDPAAAGDIINTELTQTLAALLQGR
ncbi:FCD domain-containing protein [Actinomadura bangladeshensis]|uniref:FCD domain-containing protein n=1 Tax=Actinomadura bangladeshensis TaxID=453573 RepID=A0A4V2XMZ9_9ACTN|nr:FCD domain-containing protein [Actinomadura bangladeshensis]TDC16296.1 FCD domain-containing protein [Actinomadura bangladeshensis]